MVLSRGSQSSRGADSPTAGKRTAASLVKDVAADKVAEFFQYLMLLGQRGFAAPFAASLRNT